MVIYLLFVAVAIREMGWLQNGYKMGCGAGVDVVGGWGGGKAAGLIVLVVRELFC